MDLFVCFGYYLNNLNIYLKYKLFLDYYFFFKSELMSMELLKMGIQLFRVVSINLAQRGFHGVQRKSEDF